MTRIDENLDDLIKQSLETDSTPDSLLNARLRVRLQEKAEKRRTLSLYWIPLALSLTMTSSLWMTIVVGQAVDVIQLGVFGCSVLGSLGTLVLTILGHHHFDLKEEEL